MAACPAEYRLRRNGVAPGPGRRSTTRGCPGNSDWTKNGGSGTVGRQMRSAQPRVIGQSFLARLAAAASLVLLAGCGAAHRSTAELSQQHPIGAAFDGIRIEVDNGTIGVDVSTTREVAVRGGIRRAAETAAELAQLESVAPGLQVVADPLQPRILVLRGPALPPGVNGLLGLELGIHLPADLPLEIVITGSGHVTLARRQARSKVRTGRGDLRFEDCGGGVQARTGRGNVIAFGHRGDLDVHTTVGDMQAFVDEPGKLVRLVSGQGTVQLHVPPELPFDVDARAEIGRIGNGFGLVAQTVARYGAALVGKQGAATTKVVLRTGAGHLTFSPRSADARR
ncbi:MAG: hypothetical protein MUC36_00770 [Planctomycetes bacterium]|nr:hypothetical protein [Planctomycetota bacterium]